MECDFNERAAIGPDPVTLLLGNEDWRKQVIAADPNFFPNSTEGQHPQVLWIGCVDSRVPESVITAQR